MTVKERKLIEYIAKAAQSESALLYLNPSFYLFVEPLLGEIAEIFGIDKKEISQCVDATLSEKGIEDEPRTKNQDPH